MESISQKIMTLKEMIRIKNKIIEDSKITIEWCNEQIEKIQSECKHDFKVYTYAGCVKECKICGYSTGG